MNIKSISTTKLKELITKRNKTFANKTNAEKRVLVAKDVLTQIKHKKFIPDTGNFLNFKNLDYKTTNLRESFLNGRELWGMDFMNRLPVTVALWAE